MSGIIGSSLNRTGAANEFSPYANATRKQENTSSGGENFADTSTYGRRGSNIELYVFNVLSTVGFLMVVIASVSILKSNRLVAFREKTSY